MSTNKPKVSVIIPIYNAEKYIEKCAISLFEQTLDSIEFIFVDDCSPDNCINKVKNILLEYPTRKKQVRFIRHSVNEGVSKSRQDGIDAANGEYIIHCDPDDWVEHTMYEVLYLEAKKDNTEIVISDFYTNGQIQQYYSQRPEDLTSESVLASISGSSSHVLHGGLWNKLVYNNLYRDIKFPEDISFCEDVYVLFQFFKIPHKISYVPQALYHYRVTSGSLSNTMPTNRVGECISLMNKIYQLRNGSNLVSYKKACEAKIAGLIYYLCFEGMPKVKSHIDQMLPYKHYINSNLQISSLDRQYINNFLNGHYYWALIQSKVARYRMISKNILKSILSFNK